jgi:hypothetical protein
MKKIAVFLMLFSVSAAVFASCPSWAPYGCRQMPNGKMLCGCGK